MPPDLLEYVPPSLLHAKNRKCTCRTGALSIQICLPHSWYSRNMTQHYLTVNDFVGLIWRHTQFLKIRRDPRYHRQRYTFGIMSYHLSWQGMTLLLRSKHASRLWTLFCSLSLHNPHPHIGREMDPSTWQWPFWAFSLLSSLLLLPGKQ